MNRKYDLISFDMDGTLLNSEKKITERTMTALEKAAALGTEIVISTGRAVSEVLPYKEILPFVKYCICANGALVYDFTEEQIIENIFMDRQSVRTIGRICWKSRPIVQFMSRGISYISAMREEDYAAYHLEEYRESINTSSIMCGDIFREMERLEDFIEKIVLMYRSSGENAEAYEKIRQSAKVQVCFFEDMALELICLGISKGGALRELCEKLGIPMERTIAVGDSENDRAILNAAGFSVAMGNANVQIREMCDLVVADNNHDGCAQVVGMLLTGEEIL